MSNCFQILIADHHPLTRLAIQAIIEAEAEFRVIGAAADSDELCRLTLALRPDLLVLDDNLLNTSPGTLLPGYHRRQHPALKLVLLTTTGEPIALPDDCLAALAGYMLKDEAPAILGPVLRVVSQGGVWFSRAIAQPWLSNQESRPAQPQSISLTGREMSVLQLLVMGRTDKQIAQALHLGQRTVRYILQEICNKLNANNRVEIVAQAFRLGLVS